MVQMNPHGWRGRRAVYRVEYGSVCSPCSITILPITADVHKIHTITWPNTFPPAVLCQKKTSSFSSMEQWKHLSNIMWKVSKYRLFLSYIFFLFLLCSKFHSKNLEANNASLSSSCSRWICESSGLPSHQRIARLKSLQVMTQIHPILLQSQKHKDFFLAEYGFEMEVFYFDTNLIL